MLSSAAQLSTISSRKRSPKYNVTPLCDRKKMVREAAYYIAERRGFRPGNELHDWLLAERQIDAQLSGL